MQTKQFSGKSIRLSIEILIETIAKLFLSKGAD